MGGMGSRGIIASARRVTVVPLEIPILPMLPIIPIHVIAPYAPNLTSFPAWAMARGRSWWLGIVPICPPRQETSS